ncbi:hypothetical protein ACH5RR_029961 [Cinchona calisaya]|uniref:Maturase K n=1 Tax=Cinchona calisaya TaxID=153742 RepID=A0ABD2YT63_9GENT
MLLSSVEGLEGGKLIVIDSGIPPFFSSMLLFYDYLCFVASSTYLSHHLVFLELDLRDRLLNLIVFFLNFENFAHNYFNRVNLEKICSSYNSHDVILTGSV